MDRYDFLVVGAGYVGQRLAQALAADGTVGAVVSRTDSARDLVAVGIDARARNLDDPSCAPLPPARCVLYLVPPPDDGRTDARLRRALDRLSAPVRLVYLSTTAVYGSTGGERVDEDTPPAPHADRGHRRLDAERQVAADARRRGYAATVVRVPGIYGPGRLSLDRLRRGDPVLTEADAGLTNRIHVDDLVEAMRLAASHPAAAGRLYNVTDGAPCSTSEHLRRVAALAGLPTPPTVSRAEAAGRIPAGFLAYLDESRRVDGARICRELGFVARYANPVDGIRASLAETGTGRAARS